MNRKIIMLLLISVITVVALTGCGANKTTAAQKNISNSSVATPSPSGDKKSNISTPTAASASDSTEKAKTVDKLDSTINTIQSSLDSLDDPKELDLSNIK